MSQRRGEGRRGEGRNLYALKLDTPSSIGE